MKSCFTKNIHENLHAENVEHYRKKFFNVFERIRQIVSNYAYIFCVHQEPLDNVIIVGKTS